jgi:hypothetical protein
VVLAVAVIAEAQQPKKVHRIGYLSGHGSSLPNNSWHALRKLGYEEKTSPLNTAPRIANANEWPILQPKNKGVSSAPFLFLSLSAYQQVSVLPSARRFEFCSNIE